MRILCVRNAEDQPRTRLNTGDPARRATESPRRREAQPRSLLPVLVPPDGMAPRMAGFPLTRSRRSNSVPLMIPLSSFRGSLGSNARTANDAVDVDTASRIRRWSEPCSDFICPITKDVMVDPVVASDGYTYERTAIVQVMKSRSGLSPLTGEVLDGHLFANRSLATRIHDQTQSFQQARRSKSVPMARPGPPAGKGEHPVLGASPSPPRPPSPPSPPRATRDMSTVVNILRTDGDLLSSFDKGKWDAFEVHCAGYQSMDAKEFIGGLCQLVGKRKVRRISFVITSLCVLKPHKGFISSSGRRLWKLSKLRAAKGRLQSYLVLRCSKTCNKRQHRCWNPQRYKCKRNSLPPTLTARHRAALGIMHE